MKNCAMSDAANELIVGFLTFTLSAKGTVALWLVPAMSALLIALALRIVGPSE
jgi:hypothetical protein